MCTVTLISIFFFLLDCTPQCAAAALVCTSPALAPGFQREHHQFHIALRGDISNYKSYNPTAHELDKQLFVCFSLLTVNVILQRADTLLVQTHHGWEEDGLRSRIYLHLLVEPLPRKDGGFFREVAEIWIPLHLKGQKRRSQKHERHQNIAEFV